MRVANMQLSNQQINFKKFLMIALMLTVWVFAQGLTGGQAIAKTSSKTKKSLSRQLHNVSGFTRERRILSKKRVKASILTRPKILESLGLAAEHIALINDIYKGTFNANSYYKQKLSKIRNNYHGAYVNRSIRFFRSSVGRKMVALNAKSLNVSQRTYQKFLEKIIKKSPNRNRINLLDQLETAVGVVDEVIDLEATVLQLTNPVNREFNAPHAETFINRLRSDFREQLRSLVLLEHMYNYRSLSDRELKKVIQFYESSAGKWFRKIDREGNLAGFATINRKALRHMEMLLKVIESGHQNIQTTRVVFAPGLRHLFTENRDPFAPLIVPEKKTKKKKDRKKAKDGGTDTSKTVSRDFESQLGGLPAIPYELYQRIKETNPRLYSDLEYYGALFKNKQGLNGMKPSELAEEIAQYKKLIAKAREETDLLVETPLQAKLSDLTLAGVIWDEKATIGLIETPDAKGHTIRVGSFVGPNFGVVQSIDEERVVVLEQLRSFDGTVVTRTEFIDFPQPEE
jgi:type IV pilus assembly PilP-like protein